MKQFLIVVSVIAGLGFGFVYKYTQDYLKKHPQITDTAVVEVQKGDSFHAVARRLAEQGIIEHPKFFVRIGQFYGYAPKIKFGEYQVDPGMNYRDILEVLASGQSIKYEIVFTPGSHLYDLARLLEEKKLANRDEFFALVRDQQFIQSLLGEPLESLEGYLFPDTYYFSRTDGLKTIISTMVDHFLKVFDNLPKEKNGMTRHQVVTLGSIVEKETGAPFERPMISSVFHNRLKKKMRLATDPTIIYGILRKTGEEINNIKKVHLTEPDPYNTYMNEGLPPGPIGNPGKEALEAALSPENSEYLFFVSKNDGTHVFTTNYEDHKKAIREFQLDPAMRAGKSWRDLNKKQSTN